MFAEIYGVGHGSELLDEEKARFMKYVSSPAECFYNELETWGVLNAQFTRPDIKQGKENMKSNHLII